MNQRSDPWEIPDSWAWTTTGEICEVVGGGTPRTSDSENFDGGEIPWITPADLSGYKGTYIGHGARNITRKGYQSSGATLMPKGTVLFSSRAPIGYVAIASNELTTNQGFKSFIPPNGLQPEYLRHYLCRARDVAKALASGTTFLEISGRQARKLPLALAPTPEQSQIVEALDSYFTRIDDAEATLARVKRNCERYRTSLLHAAVEGRLVTTEAELAGREQRPFEAAESLLSRTTRTSPIRTEVDGGGNRLEALPAGWCWAALESLLAEPLANGRSVRTADVGFPVLRLTAIKDGSIDLAERKVGAWTATEAADYLVARDDFFVARGNGSIRLVGRGALVLEEPDPVAFPDTFIRIRARGDTVNLRFLSYVWNSHLVRRYVERRAKTTAGIHKVNQGDLSATPLPLPPRAEQDRIVDALDRAFSIAEFLRVQVERSSCSSASLGHAVLSWAFQGRLVDQDPAAEHASVLLDRIRAERAKPVAAAAPRRGGRPRKAVKS